VKVYDVRQMDAKWWQKLTWPLARWANKYWLPFIISQEIWLSTFYTIYSIYLCVLTIFSHVSILCIFFFFFFFFFFLPLYEICYHKDIMKCWLVWRVQNLCWLFFLSLHLLQ
jgi:hypothetical protein